MASDSPGSTGTFKTREEDGPAEEERARQLRSEGRKRTIFLGVVAAGFVALFIGRAIEVDSSNDQIERSRANCESIQRVIDVIGIRALQRQADNTLGNKKKHIEPFKLEGTVFEDFKPLIIAQARQARRDVREVSKLKQDCAKVFPKRKTFIIF